jgi:hypothetical protein
MTLPSAMPIGPVRAANKSPASGAGRRARLAAYSGKPTFRRIVEVSVFMLVCAKLVHEVAGASFGRPNDCRCVVVSGSEPNVITGRY